MRILLIDDDEAFRQRLALSLQKRGHLARCADGIGALDGLHGPWDDGEALPADAVLVDLRMPGEGGLALIAQIIEAAPEARVVMLTGYGSIATAMEAVRLGAADYLTKPASIQQILHSLGAGSVAVAGGCDAPQGRSTGGSPGRDSDGGLGVGIEVASLDRVEWEHLQRVLADCGNNISRAARVLGIDRRSLQRKLAKLPPQR